MSNKTYTKVPILLDCVAALPCEMHHSTALSIIFHAVLNDQQTLFRFIKIVNTQLLDMLLMMPQIVYATSLRLELSDVVI